MIDSSSRTSLSGPVPALISCHSCQHHLDAYASDALGCEMTVAALEAHLIVCTSCQSSLAQADAFHAAFLSLSRRVSPAENVDAGAVFPSWVSPPTLAVD